MKFLYCIRWLEYQHSVFNDTNVASHEEAGPRISPWQVNDDYYAPMFLDNPLMHHKSRQDFYDTA